MANSDDEGPICLETLPWTVKDEIAFFQSAEESKPKGPEKHWHMASICDNFYTLTGKWVAPKVFWDHLSTMYNLDALEETESSLCFSEDDYQLPEEELELTEMYAQRSREKTPELSTPKVIKDYSRKKEAVKKEESDTPISEKVTEKIKPGSDDDSDEDDAPLKPSPGKVKGKAEEKQPKSATKKTVAASNKIATPKRTTRKTKELSPAVPSAKKGEETSSKKEKSKVGKRSLRSRDDDSSAKSESPAPAPPPAKRARRI